METVPLTEKRWYGRFDFSQENCRMRILFSRMSIALTWEDDYIDHVQELYHSETGNLWHTEAVLILYISSL